MRPRTWLKPRGLAAKPQTVLRLEENTQSQRAGVRSRSMRGSLRTNPNGSPQNCSHRKFSLCSRRLLCLPFVHQSECPSGMRATFDKATDHTQGSGRHWRISRELARLGRKLNSRSHVDPRKDFCMLPTWVAVSSGWDANRATTSAY